MAKPLHVYDVLVRPVITEKTNALASELRQYTFEVAPKANKLQIKEAIEIVFEVSVTGIQTLNVAPKRGRRGRKEYIRVPGWKKAIVTLADGDTIDLFNV
ncbi:MAG: 50S ribosomal protein L23 [Phototrophicaceae bacterium]|jgi:large subunit ribosomal protein L23